MAVDGGGLIPGANGDADDDFGLASGDGTSRNSRLARKAESARQARLRHKQFVTDLQDQAAGLHARIRELEAHCTSGPGSAAVAMRELKSALTPDQQNTLVNWLVEAQGENHVLVKYENGAALPPPSSSLPGRSQATSLLHRAPADPHRAPLPQSCASAPITIGGSMTHWRGGHSTSPMESDEDASAFPISRSWDDIEGARSILNLNSPNGFHPLCGGSMPPPAAFSLPTPSMAPFPSRHTHGSIMSHPLPSHGTTSTASS